MCVSLVGPSLVISGCIKKLTRGPSQVEGAGVQLSTECTLSGVNFAKTGPHTQQITELLKFSANMLSQGTPLRPGHPHFTGGVRLRTEVLPSAERQVFQPQGTSMELPSREPISHCVICVEWDTTF